jgi:hypothetical protein
MRQLYLYFGLAQQKKAKHGYMLYHCRGGWDHFIAKEKKLNMETTYFSINHKRHVYIKVSSWTVHDGEHPAKTPAVIWRL